MENYILENDIHTFCITAKSFPDGVLESHQQLHKLIPYSKERNYYGLSCPNKEGVIVYKAAAQELSKGEGKKLNLENAIIKKGNYTSIFIPNFVNDITSVEKAFKKLLANPDIDPNGMCVEWYTSDTDVRCMVRLKK